MSDTLPLATSSGTVKLRLLPSTFSPTFPSPANPANSTRPPKAFNLPPSMVMSPPTSTKLRLSGTLRPKRLSPVGAIDLFSILCA